MIVGSGTKPFSESQAREEYVHNTNCIRLPPLHLLIIIWKINIKKLDDLHNSDGILEEH